MIKGVGVDLVHVGQFSELINRVGNGVLHRMFTSAELNLAEGKTNRLEFLATRFAAKEAVYKSVVPHLKQRFDFRIIETLNRQDGSPYVNITEQLQHYLQLAGIQNVHISISTEADYAAAFAVAEG